MATVTRTFRIYDDANSEVRIYRPGMTISGPDQNNPAAAGNVSAEESEQKSMAAPANKARKSAPENKSA